MTRPDEETGTVADFDPAKLDDLRRLFGPASLASHLGRLRRQMAVSFATPPTEPADVAAVAREANALASASGMLGFVALSDASAALESACGSALATPGSIVPALADVLVARARARNILDGL